MKIRSGVAVAALLAAFAAVAVILWSPQKIPMASPETVLIAAGPQDYRPAGEFRQGKRVVDAPIQHRTATALEIMKYHVSEADYALCIAAAACPSALASNPTSKPSTAQPDFPQTNINHADASAYAAWFSDRTGQVWRLPTDAEWLRAAAERGNDGGFGRDANGDDPSRRWIASYLREVELRGEADLDPHPLGHFGVNDLGVADMAGNVWEWTETCFQNGKLTANGDAIAKASDYCGVRAVQGKHRAFVIEFIRDARSGGCGAGVPPDYLGFRLVHDTAG